MLIEVLIPVLLAGSAGFFVATGRRRVVLLLATGAALAASLIPLAYLTAPTDDRGSCSDCVYSYGRYWEPGFTVYAAVMLFVLWTIAALAGMGLRRLVGTGREP